MFPEHFDRSMDTFADEVSDSKTGNQWSRIRDKAVPAKLTAAGKSHSDCSSKILQTDDLTRRTEKSIQQAADSSL